MGQRSLAGTSESAGPCVHVHVGSGQVLGLGRHQLNTDVWHGVAADAAVTSKAQRRGNAHLVQLRGNVHAFISSLSFHQCLVFPDRPQHPQPATLPTQHAAPAVSFSLARSTPVDGLPIRHCVPRPAPWYCRWFGGTEHRSKYQIAFEFLPCVPSSSTTTTYMYILHLPQQLRDSDQTPSGPLAGRRLSLHLAGHENQLPWAHDG